MFSRFQSLRKKFEQPLLKKLSYVLRLLFSLGLLYVIFRHIDLPAALIQVAQLPWHIAIIIMALSCIRHYIQINNWRCALHLNPAYEYKRKEVYSSYLLALPLRFVIPGGHASFAKVFYLKNSSLLASVISTTTERLFMTWATWTFAAVAAFYAVPGLSLYLRIGMILFAAFMPLWAALIMQSRQSWRKYLPDYGLQAPRMMLLQIANTLVMYVQYYLILNVLASISAVDTWLSMALTNVSNSIPITISGLGLREGFAIHFLDEYGFTSEQAVAATLSLFFFQDLIPAAVGSVVLLRARRPV
ncbi:MAG: lysylphosphatidylglycerol synthase domain-containing protein [Candidatus Cloacimonetes bacterium]|nr:flippase-like domain-containing protein [Candidatus Cloacimonadota bacterium]MDD2505809.1 lysylphosphatidylglycerol synthase domain-containing protein [Candidatus Cloacimonadota bacterium]MDD4147985.1 lysylphosphatidylglycerol synthase domain-containing protein [Candidatus Cloacimonadota bacterium]MDD4560789.1 lysylphosphatidylglycerol synthase domain-containing protein [Candidatus Cloacimonadota bacterium]